MLKQQKSEHTLQHHPHLYDYTLNSLNSRKFTFLFPKTLEQEFVHKRAIESQAFINTGRYLLIALFLVIVLNVSLYYEHIILDNHFQIIKTNLYST